jgi:hypothetical protein
MTLRHHARTTGLFAAALLLAGCGSDGPGRPVEESTRARPYYPLEPGAEWRHDRSFRVEILILDGSEPRPPEVYTATTERELLGTETHFGRDYTVEEMRFFGRDTDTLRSWTRFRQDKEGLYVANIFGATPPEVRAPSSPLVPFYPAVTPDLGIPGWGGSPRLFQGNHPAVAEEAWRRHVDRMKRFYESRTLDGYPRIASPVQALSSAEPGGDPPEEYMLLKYPLVEGIEWASADGTSPIVLVVEAEEVLDLPIGRVSGFRIRTQDAALDPDDYVMRWIGTCGLLRAVIHFETKAIDDGTGESAMIITHDDERLAGITLPGDDGCHVDETQAE